MSDTINLEFCKGCRKKVADTLGQAGIILQIIEQGQLVPDQYTRQLEDRTKSLRLLYKTCKATLSDPKCPFGVCVWEDERVGGELCWEVDLLVLHICKKQFEQ